MTTSKRPGKGSKPADDQKRLFPTKDGQNVWPCHPGKAGTGRNAGRQAYTVHVARHDRQHHKPGR